MSLSHPVKVPPEFANRWQGQARFVLLDSDFGDGEHFLATWQAWRDHPQRPQQLHYLALVPDMTALHALQPVLEQRPHWQALSAELCAVWPPAVPGFHRIFLQNGQLVLTLMFGDSAACLRQIVANIDAFHLRGRSWQNWSLPLLGTLGRLAARQATLSISTPDMAQMEAQRATLMQAGFIFDENALRASFTPRFTPRSHMADAPAIVERHAIVIGAGLAGSAACQRLVRRGWTVTLIERHTEIAQEASGNTAGIFMPLLSRDDNPSSRLSRSAYLFARHVWRQLGGIGDAFTGAACGVLQIARDTEHANAQQQLANHWRYPADFAEWLDQAAATRLAGNPVSNGGWHFPAAGWVQPRSVCQAMLDDCGAGLQILFGRRVTGLVHEQQRWVALDQNGQEIARAPVLILANGCEALDFPQAEDLPLAAIRGQITHVDADLVPAIAPVICGEAYLTPPCDGVCSVGASYDEDADPALRHDSQADNLTRLENILPGWLSSELPLAGRVGFRCVAGDRLPLIGGLPDKTGKSSVREAKLKDLPRFPGLYSLLGYASRGLIWAPLAAELLAAQLDGEPLPIEADLAAALDPGRFLLKKQRHEAKPAH
ncbi:tRNA (5-methylaminomethyl-2-thiouridylate)-methyltransferase [Collimonas arenae]|uniref:tRNA 5-methylaminomethyl-2-thiouridine biosynthesis bifunctional protein MnmC n=1 Tax=Collimonas arenae TaxID=279058 RepID=A0A0A1FLL4_9BURK|nr:FAD-dependent 5-carboxymethylaminomethyl-2-thiouridine(34) oxidoreductase MnmC [Collimonas arenae]AIY43792.1 tRNA (5-methylaminomethyl-2-thiouridylate)-methyltransferase [Collimonas arenae]